LKVALDLYISDEIQFAVYIAIDQILRFFTVQAKPPSSADCPETA
jgi:hypothetical protein